MKKTHLFFVMILILKFNYKMCIFCSKHIFTVYFQKEIIEIGTFFSKIVIFLSKQDTQYIILIMRNVLYNRNVIVGRSKKCLCGPSVL